MTDAEHSDEDRAERRRGRTELVIAAALLIAGAGGVGFVLAFILGDDNQLFGIALGVALGGVAVALVVAANRLLGPNVVLEDRPLFGDPEAQEEVVDAVTDTGRPVSRRRLITGAAVAAAGGLGAAALAPLASLGPKIGRRISDTPWHRDRRLVDEGGAPLKPDDVTIGEFVTAFPEGGPRDDLGSPLVLVRFDPSALRLPPTREGFDAAGVLAFSKFCTHAGCAVNLYRYPVYAPTSPRPALVCPCHYSTFDVIHGGKVVFGPAGRPLPMLPLAINDAGELVARSDFPDQIGPSWWGVRKS